jgi:hypothetical protein
VIFEGKKSLGRTRHRWEDGIETDENVDLCICLAGDVLKMTNGVLGVLKCSDFLE